MVGEIRADHESEWAAMNKVAELLGIGSGETVRKWLRQSEIDAGAREGTSSEDSAEMKRLKRENAELKRANAILKAASAFFRGRAVRPELRPNVGDQPVANAERLLRLVLSRERVIHLTQGAP
jgi:transposase